MTTSTPHQRFGMTAPPEPGGDPGDYEEKLAQWFLEDTFFLDFVHRNPKGKRGKGELADAVVLFDDVALLVQVKAQCSIRDRIAWARKEIAKAFRQLKGTHRALLEGHVSTLTSATLGAVQFAPGRFPNRIGVIIVAHGGEPYDPEEQVPELREAPIRTHVFSLSDFMQLTNRFDTAADLICYLDFRDDLKSVLPRRVHDEYATLHGIVRHARDVLRLHKPEADRNVLERSVRMLRMQASGELLSSPDWKYGLLIDDIIARLHERDPSLPWNQAGDASGVGPVIERLAWLNRARRIALGKRLFGLVKKAEDGKDHYLSHYQRPIGVSFVFLATSASREERLQFLRFLVGAAMVKYGAHTAVGIATEPLGPGRSYDAVMVTGEISPEFRKMLDEVGSPFKSESTQLIP